MMKTMNRELNMNEIEMVAGGCRGLNETGPLGKTGPLGETGPLGATGPLGFPPRQENH